MRVVGRYFAIGASMGSVAALVSLVVVWGWMTIHLGLFGFLVGWIPAGLIAAAIWLIMVPFWGPVLIVGVMIAVGMAVWGVHLGRERHWREWPEPPAAVEPDDANAPPTEGPAAGDMPRPSFSEHDQISQPPAETAPTAPLAEPPAPPGLAAAPGQAQGPRAVAPSAHDDLGGDAAAAGDTTRKRPP
jgi:hypothetical protein